MVRSSARARRYRGRISNHMHFRSATAGGNREWRHNRQSKSCDEREAAIRIDVVVGDDSLQRGSELIAEIGQANGESRNRCLEACRAQRYLRIWHVAAARFESPD